MAFQEIVYAVESGVGVITLNRPAYRNAQGYRMLDEIDAAFDLALTDDAVRGAGGVFSTGHDLGTPEALEYRRAQYGSIFDRTYYKSPSFDQVDARLTWRAEDGKYTVIGFAKNVFDTKGYANGATAGRRAGLTPGRPELSGVFGQSTTYELNPPRTYGVELQYRF